MDRIFKARELGREHGEGNLEETLEFGFCRVGCGSASSFSSQ
jgi:hypothetical protein